MREKSGWCAGRRRRNGQGRFMGRTETEEKGSETYYLPRRKKKGTKRHNPKKKKKLTRTHTKKKNTQNTTNTHTQRHITPKTKKKKQHICWEKGHRRTKNLTSCKKNINIKSINQQNE